MKEEGLLDMSFPSFCEARHNVLCSELKQLYVAITRTRQRLWICESNDEFSKPMFDYWRQLCLVETREIDESLAQAMQTSSTPEQWKSRGVKLFWEKNYEMAIMCFEKAGEKNWEKRARAAGFRATAERIRDSYPGEACTYLREAAEIFDSIGRFESAAECFYDLREYERAGKIYLEKCGRPELIKAAECFTLAGCYKKAAEVYAKGNNFSECLAVCTKGKCFDLALKYVEYWKEHFAPSDTMVKEADELHKIEAFLENCASNLEPNDKVNMMKFVKAFPSMDIKRKFLKSVNCINELLLLEEELGNFVEAAELARLEGNILREADLVEKAGDFDKASSLILQYVLSNPLWMPGSKGCPPKPFTHNEELLGKAISFARKGSSIGAMSTKYFEKVFPLDPRCSMAENMISLRRSEPSFDLLQEFILQDIDTKGHLSYGQIGRIVMIWLASRKPSDDLYKKIVGRISAEPWKSFMEILSYWTPGNAFGGQSEAMGFSLVRTFYEALKVTYNANWRILYDYISPACFLYLVERFLLLVSQSRGYFFTTKSSLVEWLISEKSEVLPASWLAINRQSLEVFYRSILEMVKGLIFNKVSTIEWITRSKVKFDAYYKLLVLRLVVILCVLCVNSGKYYQDLLEVLRNNDVRNQLPEEFYGILQAGLWRNFIQIDEIGEALKIVGDPLLFVNLGENVTRKYTNVISMHFGKGCNREDIIELLFPASTESSQAQNSSVPEVMTNPCATSPSNSGNLPKSLTMPSSEAAPVSEQNLQMNWATFQEISDFLLSSGSEGDGASANISTVAQKVKEGIDANIKFLSAAITKPCAGEDMIEEVHGMLEELKQLHSLLDKSNPEIASTDALLKSLLSRKPKLENFLNQFVVPKDNSESMTPPEKHCDEKNDEVCGEVEKMEESDEVWGEVEEKELPSTTTESERSKQGAGKKQKNGKRKSKKHKKVKGKKK